MYQKEETKIYASNVVATYLWSLFFVYLNWYKIYFKGKLIY